MPARPFGVYVHVPFCRHRCDYCAFATWTDRTHLASAYLSACTRHIRAAAGGLPPITSVFVGGGTPSLVPPDALMAVVAAIPTTADAEVTVECNPDDVTPPLLQTYRNGGVTRVSFGVQSMVASVLAALGRTHDPRRVRPAVEAAGDAGLACNIDLVFGAAGESVEDWSSTLEEVIALDPGHISAYALTVEPGTPLAGDRARHPDDDDQATKYVMADERLARAGYECYEISNWARPGRRCRHNLLYWSGGEYLGVGCAAHSHRAGRRWWNVRTPERFIAAIDAGRPPEAAGEELGPAARRREGLQLALRTDEGVPADAFEPDAVVTLDGLVEVTGGQVRLTVAGRLLANEVAVHLR